jgi:tetratricopeptide (TPR) repeat protein
MFRFSARYFLNGNGINFISISHVFFLNLARRLWRERLESRALKSLEVDILGAIRAEDDVPGWKIPWIYRDFLDTGDARPLKGVFYHNAMDVVSMAGLLSHITKVLEQPMSFEFEHGLDLYAIGRLFEDLGRIDEAARLYARTRIRVSEEHHRLLARRLSCSHKRMKHFDGAVSLWRESARCGEIYAHVELAKYFEHKERNYSAALEWTRGALALVGSRDTNPDVKRTWQSDLDHRLKRLESKFRNDSTSPRGFGFAFDES